MKIYFTAAISQKQEFGIYYERINQVLNSAGHSVETGNLFEMTVDTIDVAPETERVKWYKKSLRRVAVADLVVVEISFPSTVNVGHELSVALEKGKPVVALYRNDRNPIFLHGIENDKLILVPYTNDDLETVLMNALAYSSEQQDVRFNFFVSPDIQHYLDWVSRYKRTPRAVYLRELLENDMRENKEWRKAK